jgi:YegS/Rv2252/BmrU family lipid kinase
VTTILLVNPSAGHGRAARLAPAALAAAQQAWGEVRSLETTAPKAAVELVREAAEAGATRIIVLGGDGTVHEAANGLLAARVDPRPPLGVVPAGTGNDFAKLCGTEGLRPHAAVARLAAATIRPLDVGEAWGEYFLNSIGVGFDADVAERLTRLRHGRGLPVYLLTVFKTLRERRPFMAIVDAGPDSFTDRLLLLEVGNGPVVGGGFRITPHARPDDGLFDVCAVQDMSVPAILLRLPLVMAGRHLGLRQCRHFRCDRLTIRSQDGQLTAQLDGEVRRRSEPLEVRILPGALPVLIAR